MFFIAQTSFILKVEKNMRLFAILFQVIASLKVLWEKKAELVLPIPKLCFKNKDGVT